ncbi:MAG: CcmD family protein [Candidatus Thorarchaeota archaeon]
MQQYELFIVATIFWGGIFVFLLYILMRMKSLDKQLKIVESQIDGDQ